MVGVWQAPMAESLARLTKPPRPSQPASQRIRPASRSLLCFTIYQTSGLSTNPRTSHTRTPTIFPAAACIIGSKCHPTASSDSPNLRGSTMQMGEQQASTQPELWYAASPTSKSSPSPQKDCFNAIIVRAVLPRLLHLDRHSILVTLCAQRLRFTHHFRGLDPRNLQRAGDAGHQQHR